MATKIGYRWGYRLVPIISLPLAGLLLLLTVSVSAPYAAVLALMATFFMIELNEGPFWAATMRVARSDTGAATGSDTTGAAACEAIVGSTDCAALVAVSPDLTLEECMTCQGAACGQEPVCDGQYPCVDGSIVLQGCCSDEQCAGLTLFCGMFIGTNNICVLDDDV